ncbi:DNA gyrase subunit A [Lentisphaerota bacterium ZTH]|nr:DNA gyrase subunit A [Lentisphaerota bacterium]WET06221.1 DNA gyrase subunit A [Lentisphaerota bacterium ZTH]
MSELSTRDYPISIEDIMHTAYLQYSLSVNVGRAIPDVRDGLKPVNRRILYAMKQLGLTKSHAYKKSASVVGEVIAKYHPHGDSSVYDAMVRLAQDFAMRTPLVDGQGNFGSIDGDSAAAYRYTEARMERLAEELLVDIDKETVDTVPTFDESSTEPTVLPARFPQLLVNGTTGIGVGMATNIPPHNLREVINATICLLENPKASVEELMQHLPGPDFPTGAIMRGINNIRRFYATGKGSCRVRARAEINEDDKGREQIIITEIPYAVNKEMMVKKIADLVNDKRITGISGLRDESSRRVGIKIVIDIKRGSMGSVVLNQLYAHTQLESSYGCTMLVVDHNRPKIMNLSQVLQAYIDHRMEVVVRRTIFDLRKAEARAHILEGLLKALDNIDEVVNIVRSSRTRLEAVESLMVRFEFSQIQANAILDMRLHQLTGLAREDVENEYNELLKQIAYYKALLESREMRLGVIKEELEEVRDKYGDERRTEITMDDSDLNVADLIARHSCVITVSNTGYIKRTPSDTYRTQHRGGKGIIGMETKEEDFVEHLFNADSHDVIFFFTDKGFMHWLNVYEIPEGSRVSKGKAIVNMIKIEPGEKIKAMLTIKKEFFEEDDKYIIMASRCGYIKKTALSAFQNLRRAGLRALTIEENDDLIGAEICETGNEVLLSTRKGMACRFNQNNEQIRPMGRTARGVTGMRFKLEGDYIVSMEVIKEVVTDVDENTEEAAGTGPELLVVSENGMGKRSLVGTYRKTKRGAKGVTSAKLRAGDFVLAALQIVPGDELMLTTERGQLVRIPCDEIRTIGRASYGVRIMNLNNDDRITGVSKIVKVEGEDDEEAGNEEDTSAEGNTAIEGAEAAASEAVDSESSPDAEDAEGAEE